MREFHLAVRGVSWSLEEPACGSHVWVACNLVSSACILQLLDNPKPRETVCERCASRVIMDTLDNLEL